MPTPSFPTPPALDEDLSLGWLGEEAWSLAGLEGERGLTKPMKPTGSWAGGVYVVLCGSAGDLAYRQGTQTWTPSGTYTCGCSGLCIPVIAPSSMCQAKCLV